MKEESIGELVKKSLYEIQFLKPLRQNFLRKVKKSIRQPIDKEQFYAQHLDLYNKLFDECVVATGGDFYHPEYNTKESYKKIVSMSPDQPSRKSSYPLKGEDEETAMRIHLDYTLTHLKDACFDFGAYKKHFDILIYEERLRRNRLARERSPSYSALDRWFDKFD